MSSPKRRLAEKLSTGDEVPKKRQKKVLSMEFKLEIIKRLERGEGPSAVGRVYGINESTVRTIRANKEAIKASIKHSTPLAAKMLKQTRNPLVEKMETMLMQWIEESNQKNLGIDCNTIKTKAKQIYEELKQEHEVAGTVSAFRASKGWFDRFRKRHNLLHVNGVWDEVQQDTSVNAAWKKMWLECVHDATGVGICGTPAPAECLGVEPGLQNVQSNYTELVEVTTAALTTQMCARRKETEVQEHHSDKVQPRDLLTSKNLSKLVTIIEEGIKFAQSIDTNRERSAVFKSGLLTSLAPYSLLLEEKRQPTILQYFNRSTNTSSMSPSSTSTPASPKDSKLMIMKLVP